VQANVQPLLKIFVDICLFRAKPEQLPYSFFLMMLCIITYAFVGMGLNIIDLPFNKAILVTGLDVSMMVGLTCAGLWIRSFLNRAVKTLAAIAGTGVLFTLAVIPVVLVLPEQPDAQGGIFSLLLLVIVMWNMGVLGHILSNALSFPFWAGIGVAIMYFYISYKAVAMLSIV
jgi:hypothetical protein